MQLSFLEITRILGLKILVWPRHDVREDITYRKQAAHKGAKNPHKTRGRYLEV